MQQLVLSQNWHLKQRDPARDLADDFALGAGWLPTTVPGSIHETLLAAGQIPDPFYGLNELDVQWIGERDWLYRCEFDAPAHLIDADSAALCCDGLDTFATVWLNGEQVLHSDNMFVPRRVPVDGLLRPGRNELHILFESALLRGKELEAEHGVRNVWNGDASRVYVRKAQYHYGWDWGPCLLTAGPWQPIRIEAGPRIAELHCPIDMADDLSRATLPVHVAIDGTAEDRDGAFNVRLQVFAPNDVLIDEATLPTTNTIQHTFTLDRPQLWWPNGYGAQPRYRLAATLEHGDTALDKQEQRLGVRRLRLVQEPLADEPGTTFLFEVNNTPIFCGGANWIPADSFTTRLTPQDYRIQLQQAADANMVMLRVWGGGIYEADVFYDLCDELGLLVWQDFMFACGIYPAHDAFQQSIRAEAESQVQRLRHHPCLALWCGNNEDYQIAQSLGLYESSFEDDFTQTSFPARELYERLIPEVCAALDPQRPYWPGSAYGGSDVSDQTVGDRHTWEVWHGPMAPYQDYLKYEGRFVSEFGMESCPSLALIESFTPPVERYPQSRTLDHHNKATDGPRHLAVYLNDTLRVPDTLEDYVYGTQFVQAEAMAAAYRGWRRRWSGPERYAVGGALVWQLNDCWPVTSWAIVDYARQPKAAYYVIRRELAPLTVGLARTPDGAEVWAVNARTEAVDATLLVQGYDLDGTEIFRRQLNMTLAPNRGTELGTIAFDQTSSMVVAARLYVGNTVVARATLWPEPFKYLAWPDPEITITRLDDNHVQVRAVRPAKGVWLACGEGVVWGDNMLDLLPDDPQVVSMRGAIDHAIEVRWVGGGNPTVEIR